MYLPIYNGAQKSYLVRIPVKKICFFAVSLPLLSFIFCVLLTMYKDFENANNTHCKVSNIFPSISASIGNYEPQNTIWKSAIYFHSPIRFFIIFLRWNYYKTVIREDCAIIVKIAIFLNAIENINLLGLSHWTSSRNYPYHELCFKLFIGCSLSYMLLTCIMLSTCRRKPTLSDSEIYSLKIKWRTFIINSGSFALAVYFFFRHNRHCEAYVYSMFGFSEYIVVLSNIAFHMTTAYDLPRQHIYISKGGITID